jgi:magnesium chelatase subunit I
MAPVVQWFDLGGHLRLEEAASNADLVRQLVSIQGLMDKTGRLGLSANESDAVRASDGEFILEGLYAHRRISRNEEQGFVRDERKRESIAPEEQRRPGIRRQYN